MRTSPHWLSVSGLAYGRGSSKLFAASSGRRLLARKWSLVPSSRNNSAIREFHLDTVQDKQSEAGQFSDFWARGESQLNRKLLELGNDTATQAIISSFAAQEDFRALADIEALGTLKRDREDLEKLSSGIATAVARGVLPETSVLEPVIEIDVSTKTSPEIALSIKEKLSDAPEKGCVLVLQDLSGTGKGTTLRELEKILPRAVCWSNGNVFRSLTLLAVTYSEQHGLPFSSDVLTSGLLRQLVGFLRFDRFGDEFDVHVNGLGYDFFVSQVAGTVLMEPRVTKNIPTVAATSQGEVINFARDAAKLMRGYGMNVLIEGRSQTLKHVRSPHRSELVLSDPYAIGSRRAAQRMMALANEKFRSGGGDSQEFSKVESNAVHNALQEALDKLRAAS